MRALFFLFALIVSIQGYCNDWDIEKYKDGVKVYTRSVEGWDVKEFRAFADIKAPLEKVSDVLLNIPSFVHWYPDISESSVLKRINDEKMVIYYRVSLPWPADDRDIVLNYNVDKDDEKEQVIIRMDANLSAKKDIDGVVRMKRAKGFWLLRADGGETKVHYQFLADPGGSMPTWLINMFIVDGPYDTIMALRKRCGA